MRQERAERTRRAVIGAAAREFGAHGFAGTSLARISSAAGVTMGALTFHFATKAELADAVAQSAEAMTRRALAQGEVTDVAGFTRTLVRLLEREPEVRAAARLTWDRPGAGVNWYETWLPLLDSVIGDPSSPEAVAALALSIVAGAELAARLDCLTTPERHAALVWSLTPAP